MVYVEGTPFHKGLQSLVNTYVQYKCEISCTHFLFQYTRLALSSLDAIQVLPDYILAVMLIVLLVATANRTLRKGIKSYQKETQAMQVGRTVSPRGHLLDFSYLTFYDD